MSYRRQQRVRDANDPRGPEMAALYRQSGDMAAVGAAYGLSAARVKDLLLVHMTADERRAITAWRHAVTLEERQAQRQLETLCQRMETAKPCVVCGAWVLRDPYYTTCSPECADAWVVSRYRLSDDHRERQRMQNARSILRHAENRKPSEVEWAKRMLSDNPPPPNRRYALKGSRASEAVRRFAS